MGPVERELRRVCSLELYGWPRVNDYRGRALKDNPSRRVVFDAAESLTGMRLLNWYWYPQIMSEAIEAASELGL